MGEQGRLKTQLSTSKKPYHKPELQGFGDLRALTTNGGVKSATSDGGGSKSKTQ